MKTRCHSGVIWALLLFSALASAQEIGSYDFTNYDQRDRVRPIPEDPATAHGGVCSGIGRLPLDVRLTNLDKSEYSPGGDVSYALRITNMTARWSGGGRVVEVPIAAGWRSIEPNNPKQSYSYVPAGLSVSFSSESARPKGFGRIPLFRSDEKPDSVIALRPGEWIVVRGKFSLGNTILVKAPDNQWHEQAYEPGKIYEFTGSGGMALGPARFVYDPNKGYETRHCFGSLGTDMHVVIEAPKLVVRVPSESGKDTH